MEERGTFTVWAMGLCLLLFLLSGISVDMWRALDARRSLNDAADIAARAGASQINVRERQLYGRVAIDPALAKRYAVESLKENSSLSKITINSTNVTVDDKSNDVTVEVHSSFSFFLLKMIPGASDAEITSRASARPFEE